MNDAALTALLEKHLVSPLNDATFLRELKMITASSDQGFDETLDIHSEIDRILTELYAQQNNADLIVQIKPHLNAATINPASRSRHNEISEKSTIAPVSDKSPRLTIGATIARPSPLERLDANSIYSSKSQMAETLDLGDAWLATDDILDRQVLLRELDPLSDNESDAVQQFVREAQIAGQLEHPNILPVYSLAWSESNSPYYTMKFTEGTTLSQHIEGLHENTLSITRASLREPIEILLSVCNAISYAHSRGVYHGQLSSDSISLGDFGEVLVMNWSNAVIVNTDQECAEMLEIDRKAIASLLYEIVMGSAPKPADLNDLANLPAKLPNSLQSILREAFLDNTRYRSLVDFASDLRSFQNDQPLIAHDDSFVESVSRWTRHHPMYVLFGTVTLVLLAFSLLTETFILRRATDELQKVLNNTQGITRQLVDDNLLISQEQMRQEKATSTAINAMTEANVQLKAARENSEAALRQRDLTRQLQGESKTLRKQAEVDYAEALRQDDLALTLLKQAEKADLVARNATLRIRKQSIATLQDQITNQLLVGRNDLAAQNARTLYPILAGDSPTEGQTSTLLKSLAGYSYINSPGEQQRIELPVRTFDHWVTNPEGPIVLTHFLPEEATTQIQIIEPSNQVTHDIPGQIEHHFQNDGAIITISNNQSEAIVAVIRGDKITFGRLPSRCMSATLANNILYVGLASGRVTTFSITDLITSSTIATLPGEPKRLAISPDRTLLACNFQTTLQIISLTDNTIVRSFPLPSECQQLWFPSNGSIALLTDKYYVNEFLFDEPGTRRIRYRPPSNDQQLVDFTRHGDNHFLLFAKGTLVRLTKTLRTKSISLHNAVHSRFLHIGHNAVLINNRDGELYSIEAATLLPNSNPIILKSPIVAATSTGSTVTLVCSDGLLKQCQQPIHSASRHIIISPGTKQVELTNTLEPLLKTSEDTISKVLPNGEITKYYQHPSPIQSYRSLGNGAYVAITDKERITILNVNELGDNKDSHILPLDVQLDTFSHHPETNTILLSSADTLYHFVGTQTYTYAHPAILDGIISLTLSSNGLKALIVSSKQLSVAFQVSLDNINYSPAREFDGFIRDVFWCSARESFLLVSSRQNAAIQQDLIELNARGGSSSTALPCQVQQAVFNPQNDELIIVTSGKQILRYSTRTKQVTTPIQLAHHTEHLKLTEDNRILVLTAKNGTIALDTRTLAPLTPFFEGNFLRPVLRENVCNVIKRTTAGLTITDIPSLLGNGMQPEAIDRLYQQ